MPLTRRAFTILATGSIALTVLGEQGFAGPMDNPANRPSLAKEPFNIGPKSKYKEAGLYQDFKKDKGVWVVSDGKQLTVLSATCTHIGATTNWNDGKKQFQCERQGPKHGSTFDLDGTNTAGKATRPLERCSLKLVKGANGAEEVEVDPTTRFRKDKDEWSNPASSLPLG